MLHQCLVADFHWWAQSAVRKQLMKALCPGLLLLIQVDGIPEYGSRVNYS